MQNFLLISLGAMLGANLRYWIGGWAASYLGAAFPYGTLIVNLSGSLILGFFITLAAELLLLDPRWRVLLAIGFLGSYTTFSSFTVESINLLLNGEWLLGILNLFGSTMLGGLCALLGVLIARLLVPS